MSRVMREKRLNAQMVETIKKMKSAIRKKMKMEQHMQRAPKWMKVKNLIMKKGGKDVDLD